MKKKVLSLLMACVLVFGTSTTVLAAGSPVVDNTVATEEQKVAAKAELNKIYATEIKDAETAAAAKAELKNIDKTVLKVVLTEDVVTRQLLLDIETSYKDAMNIKTEAVVLTDVITSIGIQGAGLNSDVEGSTVSFVAAPVEESAQVDVPETLKNSVQIDLGLNVDGVAVTELDVPVAITMNVPAGVSTDNLVILHYHNGSVERIVPVLNADGTITFCVHQFSTFVFGNETPNNDPDTFPAWGQGWPWTELEAQAAAQNAAANAAVVSPKTGDVNFAAVGAVVAMAGAAAVVVLRRKEA